MLKNLIPTNIRNNFRRVRDWSGVHLISDEKYLQYIYKKRMGKILDLKNPKTFTEKMQWLKLYERTPLHTLCADKYTVREYVSKKIGSKYLIPLIHHTVDVNDIKPENLPNYPFIIKTNHDSSGGIIIRDKSKADWSSIRKRLKKLLSRNYYCHAREWQYKHIKPQIVVEKLLIDNKKEVPYEYKLHCFNGKVKYIQLYINDVMRANIYNTQWEIQPSFWSTEKAAIDFTIESPQTLNEMIHIAEIFASDFIYLRVDLYNIGNKIYFGELTLRDGAGLELFNEGFDEKLGNLIELPKHKL